MTSVKPAIDVPLHPNAVLRIDQYTTRFSDGLLQHSKAIARRAGADEVLTLHVEEAFEMIKRPATSAWGAQFLTIVGGGLFGAFVPGFLAALLSKTPNSLLAGIYTALGLTGMLLVFTGLRR